MKPVTPFDPVAHMMRKLDNLLELHSLTREDVRWLGTNDRCLDFDDLRSTHPVDFWPLFDQLQIVGEQFVIVLNSRADQWRFVSLAQPYQE